MFMCLFLLPRRSPFCFLVYSYLFLCLVGWFPFSFRKKLKMRWTNQGDYWTTLFEKIKVIFSATRIKTSCFNRGSKRLPHTITRAVNLETYQLDTYRHLHEFMIGNKENHLEVRTLFQKPKTWHYRTAQLAQIHCIIDKQSIPASVPSFARNSQVVTTVFRKFVSPYGKMNHT